MRGRALGGRPTGGANVGCVSGEPAQVDFQTILGAISVFTLLGLRFAYLFLALGHVHGGEVFAGVPHAAARDYLFFSYTTLTTTGCGNLVPAGDIGQILAVFEMLTGQFFLVTLVAGLVSLWRPGAKAQEEAGGVMSSKLTPTSPTEKHGDVRSSHALTFSSPSDRRRVGT